MHAGGNISVTAIQGGLNRSLTVDQIISTGGNVTLVAPDGIHVLNPLTSLIQGERIELDASSGSIGGSDAIRIDSNILNDGHGGLSAKANGSINLREINGDLILIQAQGSALPAVQAQGNVTLEAVSGSILDGIHELPTLANSDPLTPQQQLLLDQLNGLAATSVAAAGSSTPLDQVVYRFPGSSSHPNPIGGLADGATYYVIALGGGKVKLALSAVDAQHGNAITLGSDSKTASVNSLTVQGLAVFDTDPLNNISADSFKFPVSPGLYSYLNPQANFLGLKPVQSIDEVNKVVGAHVTLPPSGAARRPWRST